MGDILSLCLNICWPLGFGALGAFLLFFPFSVSQGWILWVGDGQWCDLIAVF